MYLHKSKCLNCFGFCGVFWVQPNPFIFAGNVELTNMHLKPEALNALKLPIKVKAGFLGSVKLKVRIEKSGRKILESCRLYCPRSWIELSFGACCLYHHTQSTV